MDWPPLSTDSNESSEDIESVAWMSTRRPSGCTDGSTDMEKPVSTEPGVRVAPAPTGDEPRPPAIKAWCADVEKYALEKAYSRGEQIPGWKVVLSGGRRGITDDAAAIQTLIDAGYKAEQVATFKTKGIGELEKLVGKKELPELLGDLLAKSKGRESLVPESDKRQAITPALSAADDFGAGLI